MDGPQHLNGVVDQAIEGVRTRAGSRPDPGTSSESPDTASAIPWVLPAPRRRVLPEKDRRREWIPLDVLKLVTRLARSGEGWPLYLHGLPGRGKSSAALYLLDVARVGVYVTAREAIDHEFAGWEVAVQFRRAFKRADLAVIDQFGMGCGGRPGVTNTMVDVMDYRVGRPLVLVSNLPPEALEDVYDAQVRSRVEGGTVVEFTGPDWRAETARERARRGP